MQRHDIRALVVVAGISAVGIAGFGWASGDEGAAAPNSTPAPVASTTTLVGGATVAVSDSLNAASIRLHHHARPRR